MIHTLMIEYKDGVVKNFIFECEEKMQEFVKALNEGRFFMREYQGIWTNINDIRLMQVVKKEPKKDADSIEETNSGVQSDELQD